MNRNNPFPGMNPFLERYWSDVHTSLIGYIRDALAEGLPMDLNARSAERVTLHDAIGEEQALRPDVAVIESWKQGVAPQWEPSPLPEGEGGGVVSQPQIVVVEEGTERWVEITDKNGKLITVVEVLSPSNKGADRSLYRARRDAYIQSRVNLVEIDLLRGRTHSVAVLSDQVRKPIGAFYMTCVTRATNIGLREVYAMPLRDPLPSIRVPLRPGEPDAILTLQPLVDRCYRMGSYWNADYQDLPGPPLPEADATWVMERLRSASLVA
jgi:hypothetical protein